MKFNSKSQNSMSRMNAGTAVRHFIGIIALLVACTSLAQADEPGPAIGNHFTLYLQPVAVTFDLNDPPQPLDTIMFSREAYAADISDPSNPEPTGPVIGSNMVRCTFSGPGGFLCHGTLTLFGQGDLALMGPYVFQDPSFAAVTGGTGDFAGAKGELTSFELTPEGDLLYVFDLSSGRR